MNPISRRDVAIFVAGLALLSFLSRTFLDYNVVYREIGLDGGSLAGVTLFNLVFFGGWIWALVTASHGSRRAAFVLLGYCLLLVIFGVATMVSLCPKECRAAWPLGSVSIWSNLVVGVPAVWLVWKATRKHP